MDPSTALAVFTELEKRRYEFDDSLAPHFNVRLDALTTRDTVEREFRLFIRIDDGAPGEAAEDNLRHVLDLAAEHALVPTIENGGINLS